jgi:hypothetical protein
VAQCAQMVPTELFTRLLGDLLTLGVTPFGRVLSEATYESLKVGNRHPVT